MLGWLRVAYLTPHIEFFNFYTSFFAGVYNHFQSKATQSQIELSLHEFNPEKSVEQQYLQLQKIQNMDINVYICSSEYIAEYLMQHGMKVILAQGGRNLNCVNIFCDDYTAGKLGCGTCL